MRCTMLASVSDGFPLREISRPISSSVQSRECSWAGAAVSSSITWPPRDRSGRRSKNAARARGEFAGQTAVSCGGRGTFSSRLRGDDTITKDSARDCHASTRRLVEIPGQNSMRAARRVAHALHRGMRPPEGPMHPAAVAGHESDRNGAKFTRAHANVVTPPPPSSSPAGELFADYVLDRAYDEMFAASGQPRPHCQALVEDLLAATLPQLRQHQTEADKALLTQGITFTVYGDEAGTERIFPYDLLPRIITAAEWTTIERGLTQRLTAINLFLRDIYHDGRILEEGVVPRELVYSCRHYRREMRGVSVHRDIYVSIAGTDLVRLDTDASSCSRTTCACR